MFVEGYKFYIRWLKKLFLAIIPDLRHFGVKIAFYNFCGHILCYGPQRLKKFFTTKQHDHIYRFLVNDFSNIISEYQNKKIEVGSNNKKIWCMWWQGLENSPDLVKNCVRNIKKYSGTYELIFLTKDNYSDYVDIPIEIIEKVENGTITITHFSDILRAKLLSSYGGVWIDSTMFICDYIFEEFDNKIFNTSILPKFNDTFSIRLCGFFMGGKPNLFFSFLYDFFIEYNLKYDRLVNYFLIDFAIEIAYDSFDECKEYFDNITLNNPELLYFERNIDTFDYEKFKSLCNQYKFFKVTQKVNPRLFYDKDGNITYSGYFFINEEN